MESALPRELLTHIATFADKAALRILSRAFCGIIDELLLDRFSTRFDLALKGDLFSIVVRFGGADDTTPQREAILILFHLRYKRNAQAIAPFDDLIDIGAGDLVTRAFNCFTKYGGKCDCKKYELYEILLIVHYLGADVVIHPWFIEILNELAGDRDRLLSDVERASAIVEILSLYPITKPIANKIINTL